MKDKLGNEITTKEFFRRWGEGIKNITPYQQTKIGFVGIFLVIFGIMFGIYATFITKVYWLLIILSGSLVLTLVNLLGQIQKFLALKKINDMMKGGEKDE